MLQISLPENPTAEQVKRAISTIGFFAGADIMMEAAGAFKAADPSPVAVFSAPPVPAPLNTTPAPVPAPLPVGAFTAGPPELDSAGLPWDERIHSSKKTKNQDGSWKARKNLEEATKTAVTAELRQTFPAPTSAAAPAPAATQAPPPPPAAATEIPAFLDKRSEAAKTAPPPPPAGASEPGEVNTFPELMRKIMPLIAHKKLTQQELTDACVVFGVMALPLMAQHPDKIPSLNAYIDTLVAAKG